MPKPGRRKFRLTSRRKRALGWLAVLVAFVAALAAWSSGTAGDSHIPHIAQPTDVFKTSASPSVTPSPTPSGSTSTKPGAGGNLLNLLPNLSNSKNVNKAGLPARQIVITVTSDRPILRLGYRVLNGSPQQGSAVNVASPGQITTVGYGYGLVAEIGAQATPIASYITCSVTVDGHLHSKHTVYGGYSVVVCLG